MKGKIIMGACNQSTDYYNGIYYSPKGYWRGKAAITKLAEAAKVSRSVTAN